MTATFDYILIGASILLLLSIFASKASSWLGIPSFLLFLIIGMLAGSDGPGGIHFDDPQITQSLGVVALSYILFAGGLSTNWASVRPVIWKGLSLSTVGVSLTALLVGWFAVLVLHFTFIEGLLLGAIVSSTDAAAVFAVLRSQNVRQSERLQSLLEVESGSNDAMAVFLTVAFIRILSVPGASILNLIPLFVQQMVAGAILGYLLGRAMVFVINRIQLECDGLYPVLSLALVAFTYAITALLGGNGYLAVYIAGLVLGSSNFVHKSSLTHFHDGVAWLMQIVMFLTLGLLVFPSRLVSIAGIGLATALFLAFIARPISVFASLSLAKMPLREKTMVAWVGLRGAVPIILATYPLLAGLPRADMMFNVVFFVVLISILLQGPSLPRVGKWLRVGEPKCTPAPRTASLSCSGANLSTSLTEVPVPLDSAAAGRAIVELGLPGGALIVLLRRGDEMIVPGGTTVLASGDTLLIAGETAVLERIRALIEKPA
ncbi:MAG TPA: potassium/proton antiporter [Armatimonadota bacterium]|nr:potassium/proton antiporter [Armatimonadota bacterium]